MKDHLFPYEWTLEDAVFTKDQGTVFSCFACGGGSTMGYKLAGFDVIGMNEIDPKMAECYIANHNPKYSYIEPIQEFKLRDDLPDELYNLTILDGSPPCSSFSMAGNREKDWGKDKKFKEGQAEQVLDTLFFDFIDVAEKLQPKIVIAENVKGLIQGEAIKYVKEIRKAFFKSGYYVEMWLLDSSTMGVPQKRERVFFLAMRKDIVDEIGATDTVDMFNPLPFINMAFAGREIPFSEIEDIAAESNTISEYYVELMSELKFGEPDLRYPTRRKEGKSNNFGNGIQYKTKICRCVIAGDKNIIYGDNRYMTEYEYIRASSFPSDYKSGPIKISWLTGMSVPPLMTAQIATRIKQYWLDKI